MRPPICTLALSIGRLYGWRRNALAFAAGICATLTLAPFFVLPLLIPAFTVLYWLISGAASHKRAFWDGWWWGWGYYMTGLYWFCIALLTDAEKFAWLIPFALFGLTAVIAIYCGAACWIVSRLRYRGIPALLVFTIVWTLVEYARGHLFTGFPWNLAGYAFAVSDAMLQPASLVGIYGLTWLAVLLGTSLAALGLDGISRRKAWLFIGIVYALAAGAAGWGASRIAQATVEYVPDVKLRLVQANIAQHHKWDPALQMQGLEEHIRLMQEPGIEGVTHIIWPETAIPYALKEGAPLARMIGEKVPVEKILIAGALRMEGEPGAGAQGWEIWNSIMAINHDGVIVGIYDKTKLVPFGEFLPFRNFVPPAWLTPVGTKDFSSGKGPVTLDWPGLPPISPLVCYEGIFPSLAASNERRPAMLLNLTNDAWFGVSSGPHQHFHMSRARAVEQGVPLVRVANTGITAVTDALGRVIAYLPLNTKQFIDVSLPMAGPATVYGQYGDSIVWVLMVLAVCLIRVSHQYAKD